MAFKLNNIDLNGGKISSRHIMKPTDFMLSTIVRQIIELNDGKLDLKTIKEFYSNTYKNDNLSSHINMSLCEKYKSNDIAIRKRLFEEEGFTGVDDLVESDAADFIKSYLSYNYDVYCDLCRMYIFRSFERLLWDCEEDLAYKKSICDDKVQSLREEVLKNVEFVAYLKNWIENEKVKNNDFKSDDLYYLEKYRDNLNGLIDV